MENRTNVVILSFEKDEKGTSRFIIEYGVKVEGSELGEKHFEPGESSFIGIGPGGEYTNVWWADDVDGYGADKGKATEQDKNWLRNLARAAIHMKYINKDA
ncbi:hypothetical protein [Pseudomonas sp. RIT-To-2]|uniref:hypothetical protein n=1 Tax=Pseudomonas sp. RIT-To-2 TaxID=3462541 RepID=UPI0024134E16